jgi:hypothetical protein
MAAQVFGMGDAVLFSAALVYTPHCGVKLGILLGDAS